MKREGDKHGDFVLTKVKPIEELNIVLKEIRHEPSGATVVHLENDDPENVFCLSFKTWPKDSTGVAHILEHTALCGSKRFPIKDPFFSMNRRSLNTFMNAFTGSDFTCYPAASQIEKDFYNLLDVYLDAVFHPQLKKISFLQEGWRYQFSNPEDSDSDLSYQGVVFNEMKGSYSSPMTRLWDALLKRLYTRLPYHHSSGGRPENIPDLSYDELIAFHDTYYHPGNCLFFFYGNLSLKNHLNFIEQKALKNFSKAPALGPLPREKRFEAPQSGIEKYPVAKDEPLEKKTIIAFAYLTEAISKQEDVLALALLDSILMDTDASLLKATLQASPHCVSADAFLDPEMSEIPFALVFKGCDPEDQKPLKELIEHRLKEICQEGIPDELVEASLHQLEFGRAEIVGSSMPYGLTLFMRSALAMQHGCPPENALMIHSLFDALRKKVKDPYYLPSLIQKYLLNNPTQVHLTLVPSHTLNEEEGENEIAQLKKVQERLIKAQKERIVKEAKELKDYQEEMETQNLECLPKVTLDDVPITTTDFSLIKEEESGVRLFHHATFTNQVLYLDLIFDLPYIAEEELPYVHLFTLLAAELGAGERSYHENLKLIHARTGGIFAGHSLHVQTENSKELKPCFYIQGKALYRNAEHLCKIISETATSLRLDETSRIEELIDQIYTAMTTRLNSNASRYAIQSSQSSFSLAAHLSNQWYGLPFYQTIRKISNNKEEEELPKLIGKLNQLKNKLLCLNNPHLVITCDKTMYKQLKQSRFYGLLDLPQNNFKAWESHFQLPEPRSTGHIISSSVAFIAKAYPSIDYLHPYAPALYVGSYLLENTSLHRTIREQGGAYGSGAHFNPSAGAFYFNSYRDPHLYRTLNAFDEAVMTLLQGDFDERELEEAKLGVIQSLDTPVVPGARGTVAYNWLRKGKTKELRQRFRDHLLAVTKKDICHIIEQELFDKKELGITSTFAGKEFFEKEENGLQENQKPLPIQTI